MVASLVGGAILLFSCSGGKKTGEINMQTMITQQSDTLTMVYTKNGVKEYRFWTPLMERYEFARDPYMEFRRGINIITFDSLGGDNSKMRADYAIFYEKRELWEARGNVVGESADGRKLYTQQLFWDQRIDKVYSNVDCRIVDGEDEFVGEGFESDGEFKEWVFRESEGRMWIDASQSETPQSESEVKAEKESKQPPQSYLEAQERHRRENQERNNKNRAKAERAKAQEKRQKHPEVGDKEHAIGGADMPNRGEGLKLKKDKLARPMGAKREALPSKNQE